MGMAVRGEVLRLFGAEVSMVIRLGVWLSAHGRIMSRREVPGYDASNCDFGFVLLLELEGGEQWMFCLGKPSPCQGQCGCEMTLTLQPIETHLILK